MKQTVKKLIGSNPILRTIFVKFQNARRKVFDNRALQVSKIARTEGHGKVFDFIYKEKYWNTEESASGWGSTLEVTKVLRPKLENLMKELKIQSFFDVPCGDFNWMKEVNFGEVNYIGGDIVKDLVDMLNKKYASGKRTFIVSDVVSDKLPDVDMIFIRDCFIHLNNDLVCKALANIKNSHIKYLVTTHSPMMFHNSDIETGQFRDVNLTKAPFNLPAPMIVINEGCEDPLLVDKSLGVWDLTQLRNSKS